MSRGLGRLQSEIFYTLGATNKPRCNGYVYRGMVEMSTYCFDSNNEEKRRPWVIAHGWRLLLADGAYDLRAVAHVVAVRHGKIRQYVDDTVQVDAAFRSSFSRAVKGLIERGALVPLAQVPFDDADPVYPYTWSSANIPNIWRWNPQSRGNEDAAEDGPLPGLFDVSDAKQTRFVAKGISGNSDELPHTDDGTAKRQLEQVDA